MAILLGHDDDLSRALPVLGRAEALLRRLSNADGEASKGPVEQKFHRDGSPGGRGLQCSPAAEAWRCQPAAAAYAAR